MDKEHVEWIAEQGARASKDTEEQDAKVALMLAIKEAIGAKGLTQRQASDTMRVTQQQVTQIERGTLESFGLDRLIGCARALGIKVSIQLTLGPGIGNLTVTR